MNGTLPEEARDNVRRLMASVLNVTLENLPPGATPDNTSGWDSLSHLSLIAAMERQYNISISHEDAIDLLGETEIIAYLAANDVKI